MGVRTFTRGSANTGMKAGLGIEAAIVGENLGIAPEVTGAISDAADKIPTILEVSSDIPGVGTVSSWIIENITFLDELSKDVGNMLNIGTYASALGLVYLLAKFSGGKKGKLEAFGSSVIWTAVAAGLLSEVYQYTQGNGGDLLGYLPKKLYEAMPEGLENFLSSNNREMMQGVTAGTLGLLSLRQAKKNIDTMRGKNKDVDFESRMEDIPPEPS